MSRSEFEFAYDHIQKLLERRQAATSFYFSVNTGVMAALGLLLKDYNLGGWWTVVIAVLLIAGFIACWIWRCLIRHYAGLLDWWYARLRDLEESKPKNRQLITREYEDLYRSKGRHSITRLVLTLNWTFSVLYAIFAVGLLLSWLASCKLITIPAVMP